MTPLRIAVVVFAATLSAYAQNSAHPVAAMPAVRHWQLFTDPNEGAFQLEMPQGWNLAGGTARQSALQYRSWATAASPDRVTVLVINDPAEPNYLTPGPMLDATGFHVGSIYNAGAGNSYVVAPYQNGVQFAARWGMSKLAAHCTNVRVTNTRPRPDLSGQINQLAMGSGITFDYGEVTFACDRNTMPLVGYVCARTFLARVGGPGGIWAADSIQAFVAPAPVAGLAAGLLAHMVGTIQVNTSWAMRQSQTTMAVSRINAQANSAVSDMIMRGWEERGAIMDRVMQEGSRARLGIDVYSDPVTGMDYTVQNTSRYYWVNEKGTIVGTDTDSPPDPSFRSMKRVPPQ